MVRKFTACLQLRIDNGQTRNLGLAESNRLDGFSPPRTYIKSR
jgi:hypothetical protein